jgi:predicted TIM-barrel fold metal-dependent hydrolase
MCLLEALATLGPNGRGIAVVQPSVGDQELRRLNEGSIRGLRFSLWNPVDAVTTIDMIEPLAMRIAELGWHVQLHMSADQIVASTALLARLPCPIVFDHMGRLPPSVGSRHPAFAVIMRLVDRGRAWVKLSGAYLNTRLGPPYADTTPIASAYVKAAPERLVWGSDWPHVTESHKPDARQLLDLLGEWASDEITRTKILVDNPAKLYGFV